MDENFDDRRSAVERGRMLAHRFLTQVAISCVLANTNMDFSELEDLADQALMEELASETDESFWIAARNAFFQEIGESRKWVPHILAFRKRDPGEQTFLDRFDDDGTENV